MRELDQHGGKNIVVKLYLYRLPLCGLPLGWAVTVMVTRNVTHNITQEVLWLSRWKAADLYLRDIEALRWELSIQECSDELGTALGQDHA